MLGLQQAVSILEQGCRSECYADVAKRCGLGGDGIPAGVSLLQHS